jgi:DNA-directed RNA polymerase
MFTPEQYRTKAAEYTELARATSAPSDMRELQQLERSFTALADNEQWLSDNYDKTVHATEHQGAGTAALAADEERILRCLGAALIMQWNTLPTKLRRELFDNAGSMGELLDTAVLRGQIARFLHKHKDDEDEVAARASS